MPFRLWCPLKVQWRTLQNCTHLQIWKETLLKNTYVQSRKFLLFSKYPTDPNKAYFSKFYGKVGVIFWFLFHLIWKNYVLYWDFDLKSWIGDFFTRFTRVKTPQNNFSSQNFSVENNYLFLNFMSLHENYKDLIFPWSFPSRDPAGQITCMCRSGKTT